ncbi:MAG: Rhs element Vgr protein, partial [Proteobacteria bacterium]|nr:Rhs element Vgr protein [Pseudomonadota bacterium]
VLQAGQSSVTLEGANITFACPGTFSVKGSGNAFVGPGSGVAEMEALPEGTINNEYSQRARLLKPEDKPYEQHRYQLVAQSGKSVTGIFGKDATTQRLYTDQSEPVQLAMTEFRIDQKMTEDFLDGLSRLLGPLERQTTPDSVDNKMIQLTPEA